MMNQQQLALLCLLNEAESIQCQEHCQREMEATLNELRGLVVVSEMPDGARVHLMQGLFHLECHIRGETKEMTVEVGGRYN